MEIDWRSLLDSLRVEWTDRGKNTSRGNISILCPFCRDDPSYHLSISETSQAYYCYRNPQKHSGRSFSWLLRALGVPESDCAGLLQAYRLDRYKPTESRVQADNRVKGNADSGQALDRLWRRFLPVSDASRYLTYLRDRGFPDPERVASQYRLRYAPEGEWAARLIIPFYGARGLLSWTGRAITSRLQPKYRMPVEGAQSPLYLPHSPAERLVIVEGPLDALKVAVASEHMDVCVVAMAGLALNPAKLVQFRELSEHIRTVHLALDSDVLPSVWIPIQRELQAVFGGIKVSRLRVPEDYGDPGAMPISAIQDWLSGGGGLVSHSTSHPKADRPTPTSGTTNQ